MAYSPPTLAESTERIRNLRQVKRWRAGDYEPGPWFTDDPIGGESWGSWGRRFEPTRRGVTFFETNRARPDLIPEEGAGADREVAFAASDPRFAYQMGNKYEVWSDNLESLLDEALSRQWSATSDIPWGDLEPLPEELERSVCQFVCFLHAVEFTPTDNLPTYMSRIDPSFPEARMFLSTQCVDESRHMEVFVKRMFANGGGPGVDPTAEGILQTTPDTMALPSETTRKVMPSRPWMDFLAYSYHVQILGEAVVLDLFRFGEFLGRNNCDKQIFRRVMQDEARHVSYGTLHLKYFLENAPKDKRDEAFELVNYLAAVGEAGATGFNLLIAPSLIEPWAVLAAGGTANMEKGWEAYREFWAVVVENYLKRMELAGVPRWDKCLLPREAPF